MLSRLKSTVKGVVGMVRGAPPPAAPPAVRPAQPPVAASAPRSTPPIAAKPVEPPKPAPVAAALAPVAAAPVAGAPIAAADAQVAAAVAPAAAAVAQVASAVAPTLVAAPPSAPAAAEAPRKLSLAERAAAAAKAPAPVPSHAASAKHDDDDHDDDHAPVRHTAADTGSTDKAAYILRAKANGRDVATVIGEEGLNSLEDGTQFWGPVNNSSSRAKAESKVLTIDQFECISCGTCVEQTEKVFFLPADGKATPIAQDGPMDLIEDAIEACPVTCIAWTTSAEAIEKGLATGENLDEARA